MEGSYLSMQFKAFPIFSLVVIWTVDVVKRTALLKHLLEDVNFECITASPHALHGIFYFWISRHGSVASGSFCFSPIEKDKRNKLMLLLIFFCFSPALAQGRWGKRVRSVNLPWSYVMRYVMRLSCKNFQGEWWGIIRGTMHRDHKCFVVYPNGCMGCQWERRTSTSVVPWGFMLRIGKS